MQRLAPLSSKIGSIWNAGPIKSGECMKSSGVARARAPAIRAISFFLGHRNDDLSTFQCACRNIMKRLQPQLGQAIVNLQIGREKLRRAKENGCLNGEVVQKPQRSEMLSGPSLDEASPGLSLPAPTSSAPALAREREGANKFLDDFEKELWERTRSAPKARTSPGPPTEEGDKFLRDLEEAVQRFILEQDRKG
jgi:hypothetical protein